MPAPIANLLQTGLEGMPVLAVLVGRGGRRRVGTRTARFVHAAVVLREKILSVEIVVDLLVTWHVGVGVRIT